MAIYGTLEYFLATCLLTAITIYAIQHLSSIKYPAELPRVREVTGKTRFSLRTRLAYFTDCEALFREAYEKYSKNGKTCLLPGLGRDDVTLPTNALRWLTSQPDRILDNYAAFEKVDQIEYSLGSTKYVRDPWSGLMVKKDINRVLETIVISLNEELVVVFDDQFGTKNSWTDIQLLKTMKRVVAQGSSRFTVGWPLCRNEEYLKTTIAFTDQFVINAGLMALVPNILRPILGPVIATPTRYITWKIEKLFKPLYRQRIELIQSSTVEKDSPEPLDLLQMMLRYAQTNRKEELNLHDMARRLAMSNLGSYHQTSIAMTNIIFNIIASDEEYNTISVLREEIIRTKKEHGKEWNKSRIANMIYADSVCRETLRLHSFGGRGPFRVVMVDDLRTEDGILLPKGSMVSVLGAPAQCDGDNFTDPFKFDPFRFARIREAAASTQLEEAMMKDEKSKLGKAENLNFVSTGSQHLAFGHGRHACPGRFLLDFELKMMIAYLVTNYDFEFPREYGGQRPKGAWVAEAYMPPAAGRIRVKRRQSEF